VVPFFRPYPLSRQRGVGVAYREGKSDTPPLLRDSLISFDPICVRNLSSFFKKTILNYTQKGVLFAAKRPISRLFNAKCMLSCFSKCAIRLAKITQTVYLFPPKCAFLISVRFRSLPASPNFLAVFTDHPSGPLGTTDRHLCGYGGYQDLAFAISDGNGVAKQIHWLNSLWDHNVK